MSENTNWEQNARDLAKVRDELYVEIEKLQEENLSLKSALKNIITNAPQSEPQRDGISQPRGYAIAHSFWYAAKLASELLARIASK